MNRREVTNAQVRNETIVVSKTMRKIEFLPSHRPALPDGDYALTVTQQVTIDGQSGCG